MNVQLCCCLGFALGLMTLSGCATKNTSALKTQQEKEQLTEIIRSQRETNNTLKERTESLTKRLDEAEKELAVLQGRGTRFAFSEPVHPKDSPTSTGNPIREPASPAAASTAKAPEEKLPWRPARTGSKPVPNPPSTTR